MTDSPTDCSSMEEKGTARLGNGSDQGSSPGFPSEVDYTEQGGSRTSGLTDSGGDVTTSGVSELDGSEENTSNLGSEEGGNSNRSPRNRHHHYHHMNGKNLGIFTGQQLQLMNRQKSKQKLPSEVNAGDNNGGGSSGLSDSNGGGSSGLSDSASGGSNSGSGGEEDTNELQQQGGHPNGKAGQATTSTTTNQEQQQVDAILYVRKFMEDLRATKPNLTEHQKRNLLLKNEEKRERKRKVNRLSAQRKRIRERDLIASLSEDFKKLGAANQALKRDSDQLRQMLDAVKQITSKNVNLKQMEPSQLIALLAALSQTGTQPQSEGAGSSETANAPKNQASSSSQAQAAVVPQHVPPPAEEAKPAPVQLRGPVVSSGHLHSLPTSIPTDKKAPPIMTNPPSQQQNAIGGFHQQSHPNQVLQQLFQMQQQPQPPPKPQPSVAPPQASIDSTLQAHLAGAPPNSLQGQLHALLQSVRGISSGANNGQPPQGQVASSLSRHESSSSVGPPLPPPVYPKTPKNHPRPVAEDDDDVPAEHRSNWNKRPRHHHTSNSHQPMKLLEQLKTQSATNEALTKESEQLMQLLNVVKSIVTATPENSGGQQGQQQQQQHLVPPTQAAPTNSSNHASSHMQFLMMNNLQNPQALSQMQQVQNFLTAQKNSPPAAASAVTPGTAAGGIPKPAALSIQDQIGALLSGGGRRPSPQQQQAPQAPPPASRSVQDQLQALLQGGMAPPQGHARTMSNPSAQTLGLLQGLMQQQQQMQQQRHEEQKTIQAANQPSQMEQQLQAMLQHLQSSKGDLRK